MPENSPRVGLFVTCLVDLFRPSVGFAAVKLLEDAGCTVEVPRPRPAAASRPTIPATRPMRAAIARNVIAAFEGYRLRRGAVRLLRRHDQSSTIPNCSPTHGRTMRRPWSSPAAPMSSSPSSSTCMKVDKVDASFAGARHLSRLLLGPARARHQGASRASCWPSVEGVCAARDDGCGGLLRLRRHLLRQVSRHLRQDGGEEAAAHRTRPAPTRCSPAISAA